MTDPTPPSPTQHPGQAVDREQAKSTLRRLRSALIATSDRLDVPYTDAPESTPWSRYINPAMSAVDATFAALLADLDAARERVAELEAYFGRPGIPTYEQLSEAFGDALKQVEDWRGEMETLVAELTAAEAERDRMRPVVEAARAWRHGRNQAVPTVEYIRRVKAAVAAVDTYEPAQEER